MRDLFAALSPCVSLEEVDRLREREDRGVARKDDGDGGDDDEERLEVVCDLGLGGRAREERKAEVDEDKVLRELRERGEDVLRRALCTSRHGVVCVVLQGDAAEEQ